MLSEPMQQRVRRWAPQAADRIRVIYRWADPERIRTRPKSDNWFAQKHELQDTFTVLYSGNQGRCHDLVTVLAAALLLRHDSQVRFLFVGSGPQNERLRNLVHDWGLNNCRFLPYQDLEDLPYSLAAAGTPIAAITPADSYLRQLVESSGCGRWFANGDADGLAGWIRQLRSDPAHAHACGAAARQLLERTATSQITAAQYRAAICRHLPEKKLATGEQLG